MPEFITRFERSRGCLLAGAAGDALGAPVEFMGRDAILQRFGPGGIRDYAIAYGGIGRITDDTQMTLFTAEGCLRALVRSQTESISHPPSMILQAYLRWLHTQGAHGKRSVEADGWLMTHRELFSRRAPGMTCLTALVEEGGEHNDSKGCGGIMRVAPCGIVHAGDPGQAFELGCEATKLTHGHPTGYLAAGAFSAIIADLMTGKPLAGAISLARVLLLEQAGSAETIAAIDNAVSRAANGEPADRALPALGEGWIAEETLAIALYCALRAANLEEGIVMAVNITGDSDSTGAVTGNLLGAIFGPAAIPERWLVALELQKVIQEVADDLATMPQATGELADAYHLKYPPN